MALVGGYKALADTLADLFTSGQKDATLQDMLWKSFSGFIKVAHPFVMGDAHFKRSRTGRRP